MKSSAMEWHACYSTPFEIQAHLVKGYLEQFGVPCVLENQRFRMKPLTFCALGEVRVLVQDDWLRVAQGLLRGRDNRRQDRQSREPLRLVRRDS